MKGLIHSSIVQYAVIRVSSTKGPPERLVSAYPDERSLCDLIAAPSILGRGFASHEEAVATVKSDLPDTNGPKLMPATTPLLDGDQKCELAFHSVRWELADGFRFSGFNLSKTREIAGSLLHFAVATAILIFYSRNIVSAPIRRVLGT